MTAPEDTRAEDALVEKVADQLNRVLPDNTRPWLRNAATAAIVAVRAHEAGIAAAVEALADEWMTPGSDMFWMSGGARLRAALADTGAADALAARDAKVLREAADFLDDRQAATWDFGYAQGTRDAEGDTEPADNPYREAGGESDG